MISFTRRLLIYNKHHKILDWSLWFSANFNIDKLLRKNVYPLLGLAVTNLNLKCRIKMLVNRGPGLPKVPTY